MPASHWHLIRKPIPIDHEMPFAKEGSLVQENVCRAFGEDRFQAMVVQVLIHAAFDNKKKRLRWAGVNAAYVERCASAWWITEIKKSYLWFLKGLWFPRSLVVRCFSIAMGHLLKARLVEELIEWDPMHDASNELTGSQKMPVYYPTALLVERLNEALDKTI